MVRQVQKELFLGTDIMDAAEEGNDANNDRLTHTDSKCGE
jgi:hypothetical protein